MFIYGKYGAAGAAKASEKLLKSQPRVLFLRGKMEAQESHTVFELERGMFPEGMLELYLVCLGFCLENSADAGNHRHFEGPCRSLYPIRATPYQQTICACEHLTDLSILSSFVETTNTPVGTSTLCTKSALSES